jgi:hypothetical protein
LIAEAVGYYADEQERDAEQKREKRLAAKDLKIPPCANPERRRNAETSSRLWLATYGPDYYRVPFSPQINSLVDAYERILAFGGNKAVAATRGVGKSTIVQWLTVCLVLRGLLDCALIIGQNDDKAGDNMDNIKTIFTDSEILQADYPEAWIPFDDIRGAPQKGMSQTYKRQKTMPEWTATRLVFPKIPGFKSSGFCIGSMTIESGGLRGFNHRGKRPKIVIIDDPETEESAVSEKMIATREKIIEATIAGMGTPTRPVGRLMITTIQNRNCLSWKFTDPMQKPAWQGERFAFLKQWPERKDLWLKYVSMRRREQQAKDPYARGAHQFYLERFDEMNAGSVCENNMYNGTVLPDGSQVQVSALQRFYDEVADQGEAGYRFVLTEWQNDPPPDDDEDQTKLTPDEVASRLNGLARYVVPEECETLVVQIDLHMHWHYYTVMATSAGEIRDIVDYGLELVPIADEIGADNAIRMALDKLADQLEGRTWTTGEGRIIPLDLAMVDAGYKQHIGVEFVTDRKGVWRLSKGRETAFKTKPRSVDIRPGEHWQDSRQPGCDESGGKRWWLIEPDTDYWLHQVHSGFRADPFGKDGVRQPGIAIFGAKDEPEQHLANVDRTVSRSAFAVQICGWLWESVTTKAKGTYMAWVPQFKQDHWLDTTYGCLVADQVLRDSGHLDTPPGHVVEEPKEGFVRRYKDGWVRR